VSPVGTTLLTSADRGGVVPVASPGEEVLQLVTDIASRGVEWRNAESQRLADRAASVSTAASVVLGIGAGLSRRRRPAYGFGD
jgi:hypothetical protein